jgi:hypothetical protein
MNKAFTKKRLYTGLFQQYRKQLIELNLSKEKNKIIILEINLYLLFRIGSKFNLVSSSTHSGVELDPVTHLRIDLESSVPT